MPVVSVCKASSKCSVPLGHISTSSPLSPDSGVVKLPFYHSLPSSLLYLVYFPSAELSLGEVDAVEIIGGSCRIPAVKDAIMSVFKCELSTTLNLDEAVSRGCGLQCAMLSPTFKVRDFSVCDIQPYPIQLKWQAPLKGDSGYIHNFIHSSSRFTLDV